MSLMPETYEGKETEGTVLRIERSSFFDGDGFRTVVFLKGCSLRCWWCSAPESQNMQIEGMKEEETRRKIYGRRMTVEEVLREVRKDSSFYFHSGGGMTLSGGEPLSQPYFSRCLLQQTEREGIDTVVETTFYGDWGDIDSILHHVSAAYVDLKIMNPEEHKKYCGVDNKKILENLKRTNETNAGFRLVIRVPVIPGINDSEENLHRTGAFAGRLKHLDAVELLPCHSLGAGTYRKLGRPYLLPDLQPPSSEELDRCREILSLYVKRVI